jgi:feruloyl esterase
MKTLAIVFGAFALVGVNRARSTGGEIGAPTPCEQLTTLKNMSILSAERVTTGAFTRPGTTDSVTKLPAFCRVVGEARPTPDSHIAFEVWLPLEKWNGKFAGVGNGGWAGIISYPALGEQLRRGYATVSTNTGHAAEPGFDMAKFGFGHPERLIDFGWRSVHEMTVKGKAITEAFYGRAPRYAYWIGCSTGGKQGLTEAQRFPADYDGIVAEAPANNWSRLMAGTFALTMATTRDSASYLTPAIRRMLHGAARRACDARDGVVDSLITNPAACVFDPASVQCQSTTQRDSTCLTAAQVLAASRVYSGLKDPNGRVVFPGLAPGSEPFWGAFATPGRPFPIPISYYRWIVFGDSTWDWKSFDLTGAKDYAAHLDAGSKIDAILAAVNPDLRAFKARGGKLIQTHGWNDQLISPQNSIDYYESVVALERGARDREATVRDVQRFFRLFMVPGMLHCGGGPGPNIYDAEAALESWVERGVAPDSIVAASLNAGTPVRTRPLCAYPKVAKYNGSGDFNKAESFSCGVPAGG